jgi:2,5-dihydroxypyridine 5,6-dioxygenase
MREDRLEPHWVDLFERILALSEVRRGEQAAVLTETLSSPLAAELARHALHRAGAVAFRIELPSPATRADMPLRSTGASDALRGQQAAVAALAGCDFVLDLTVEGLLHAPELAAILRPRKARVLYLSAEHPAILERLEPTAALRDQVLAARKRLRAAKLLRVTSPAGTDLRVRVEGAPVGCAKGAATRPGEVDHVPAGLVAAFPGAGTTEGVVVLAPGDMNLTFKRIVESTVRLVIEADHVVAVEGTGADAAMLRDHYAAWGDPAAYATSHIGWGLDPRARWESLAMFGREIQNGVEQRVFAGSVLYSTGASEFAGRYTLCHFDLPLRDCTLTLDGAAVVRDGRLVEAG